LGQKSGGTKDDAVSAGREHKGGDWPISNPTRAAILEPFFTVNAAFGLGLLFLIAGYFVPHAYDRKGARRFLTDRLIRLGLPLLVVSLVLFLPLGYAMDGQGQPFGPIWPTTCAGRRSPTCGFQR